MTKAPGDIDRPHELVGGAGERWFGWRYHWTILKERKTDGVREVLIVPDEKPGKPAPAKKATWVDAWRLQKFCTRTTKEDNA